MAHTEWQPVAFVLQSELQRPLSTIVSLRNFNGASTLPDRPCAALTQPSQACSFAVLDGLDVLVDVPARDGVHGGRAAKRRRKKTAHGRLPLASISSGGQQQVAAALLPSLDATGGASAAPEVAAPYCSRQRQEPATAISPRQQEAGMQTHARGDNVKRLLCGALSAIVSRTMVAPLERIKLDLVLRKTAKIRITEVAAEILAAEGWRGMWRGNALNLIRTTPYKAINYSSYDFYKQQLALLSGGSGVDEKASRFLAGAMAGITAMSLCFPLDVVRTRVFAGGSARSAGNAAAVMQQVLRQEGIRGLYSGFLPAIISIAPSSAVFYGTFDLLKDMHLQRARRRDGIERGSSSGCVRSGELGAMYTLLFSAAAGALAELSVYPLEVIRRRMQLQSMHAATAQAVGVAGNAPHASLLLRQPASAAALRCMGGGSAVTPWQRFMAAAVVIARTEGPRGFYTGLLPNVLQVLPSAALSYYTYDLFKRMLAAQ